MFNWNKKEAPLLGLQGSGGGLDYLAPKDLIFASGGTIRTPGDGYRYHIFGYGSSDNFEVRSGAAAIEVLIQAGGGGGGSGRWKSSPGNTPGGSGGGGGGTVLASISSISPSTYPITVGGAGSAGGYGNFSNGNMNYTPSGNGGVSTFTLPYGNISTGGGTGGANSTPAGLAGPGTPSGPNPAPASTNPNVTIISSTTGGSGGGGAGYNGGAGAPSGGGGAPFTENVGPGAGAPQTNHSEAAAAGSTFGGGGGGGGGSWDSGNAVGGAVGGEGRIVIRYELY